MNIVYIGSGEFGIHCLNALANSDHTTRLIVTQPPQPAGRGQKTKSTPVASWSKEQSIPFVETDNVNSPECLAQIQTCRCDLIVVIAFGQKIAGSLINLPPKGIINVHGSLLPKYRGAAPINWAVINGEKQTGISIITVVDKMDAGDILSQAKTDIGPDETAGRLHDRLAVIAAPLLIETIDKIADGTAAYTKQDNSKATLAGKLKKSDGFLDFSRPAEILRRKILGLWPWPGSSAVYVSKNTEKSLRVSIAGAKLVESSNPASLPPGTLDENLNVICGRDALAITKIKPAGCHLMDFRDFINGRATSPGDMFTKIDNQDAPR